jgi:hypothetical protein
VPLIPGVQIEDLCSALRSGFSKQSLKEMLRTRLDRRLDDLVSEGPLKEVIFELVELAELQGWLSRLVCEAYRYNPTNDSLSAVYEKYGWAPSVVEQHDGVVADSDASVSSGVPITAFCNLPTSSLAIFRERLLAVELGVCSVEIDGTPVATGFLVGPDVVLTAYHSVDNLVVGKTQPSGIAFRFDYKELAGAGTSAGMRVGLRQKGHLVCWSPFSQSDIASDSSMPAVHELNYAILRLSRPVGDEAAAPYAGAGCPRRGWLTLPKEAPDLLPRAGLIIAQHPLGRPLQLAVDTESYFGINSNGTRVRYSLNTSPGSSGSPVFDISWRLVAMHHRRSNSSFSRSESEFREEVPAARIRAAIIAAGHSDVLGSCE